MRQVQASDGHPGAVVRCAELERDFMRAWWLRWSFGLGARVRGMLKVCAALTLLAFILKGPVERREAERNGARAQRAAVVGQPREGLAHSREAMHAPK